MINGARAVPVQGAAAGEAVRLGSLLKQAAALSGVCYACGFIILNASLGRLGVYSFSLASSRVLAAGLLYLLLSLLSGVGWLAVLLVALDLKAVAQWSKPRLYVTFLLGWMAGAIFGFLFYWGLWSGLLDRSLGEIAPALVLWALCNPAALVLLAGGGLYSAAGRGGLIWPALGLVLFLVALQLFGSALHPRIPGGLGGGEPLRAQLLVEPAAAAFLIRSGLPARSLTPPGLGPGDALYLTGPVELVDSGSEGYILNVEGRRPVALLLAKENVQGIVHLE